MLNVSRLTMRAIRTLSGQATIRHIAVADVPCVRREEVVPLRAFAKNMVYSRHAVAGQRVRPGIGLKHRAMPSKGPSPEDRPP